MVVDQAQEELVSEQLLVSDQLLVEKPVGENSTPHPSQRNEVKRSREVNDRSWLAKLELRFEKRPRGTRLTRNRHVGPLYVQKPFYPEGDELAHVYLLHPPGGLVSGDDLRIQIDAQENTAALMTTPGAARIYRARDDQPLQRQTVKLKVGANASLEWFPLETIVYNKAHVELDTEVHLSDDSKFMGWEINCFGLPAGNAPFNAGSFQQRYQIFRRGRPLFVDRFSISNRNRERILSGLAGMQGHAVNGFFLAGPCNMDTEAVCLTLEKLRQIADEMQLSDSVAITKNSEFIIGRYLGGSAEQARKIFTEWWKVLRPITLRRQACPPRIWAT
ncbi:MAG: urease accessory protein [Moraxellaceae bacterium]|nr:MAG: urease accessory protein [Moraxellaceae bacterium]